MKKIVGFFVLVAMAGLASAGGTDPMAASADLTGVNFAALRGISTPVTAPVLEKAGPSQGWVGAVKEEYIRLAEAVMLNTLPKAKKAELPAAAQEQLKKDLQQWGTPSKAYKMEVQGQTAFVIQNDNEGGMAVTIFDESGTRVASASMGESGSFSWDKTAASKDRYLTCYSLGIRTNSLAECQYYVANYTNYPLANWMPSTECRGCNP